VPTNVLYRTSATATGGRVGHAATPDGNLKVGLARPKELGGDGAAGTNPEQLFAAGYAACFLSSMQFVATQGGPKVPVDANRAPKAVLALRSGSRFICLGWQGLMLKPWCKKPIRSAPTRTQRVTASTCAWTSLKPGEASSGRVQTLESINDQPKQRRKS
jgi:hypothetical protein